MGKNETRLTDHMRRDGAKVYGNERLIIIKYHGNAYSQAGVSDLLGCLDGTFFACEVKAPESYGNSVQKALTLGPTIKQDAFIRRVQQANGYAWVAATREQFLEGLAAIDEMNRQRCVYCQEYTSCHIHPLTDLASM